MVVATPDGVLTLDESWRYACAGYTGRDRAVVLAHIAELERIGVAPPPTVPTFYRIPPYLVTGADRVWAPHEATSGEIEPVFIIRAPDRIYVSVGSDHTDRRLEAHDVDASKWLGQKVMASAAWAWADVGAEWDRTRIRSWVEPAGGGEPVPFQDGRPADLLDPGYWVDTLIRRYGSAERWVLFGGTIPHAGVEGPFRAFAGEMVRPSGDRLAFRYTVSILD
jgi:hypothetical protein